MILIPSNSTRGGMSHLKLALIDLASPPTLKESMNGYKAAPYMLDPTMTMTIFKNSRKTIGLEKKRLSNTMHKQMQSVPKIRRKRIPHR